MATNLPQWQQGTVTRQAHVGLPPGTVEDEHGRGGFSGPASHLYRLHAPTGWTSVDGPAAHRAWDTTRITNSAMRWPLWLLTNGQVAIGVLHFEPGDPAGDAAEFLRDADGDLCWFVHTGVGVLATEYGPLHYQPGDFLVVPRGTTFRFEPAQSTHLLAVEAIGSRFDLPDRGLLGRHAPFDPAILEVPEPAPIDESGDFAVVIKRDGEKTVVRYPFHPFDVVGWKGDVAPMRLNVADHRPIVSPRYHLPPSVHTDFVADGLAVGVFAPRPLEEDPDSVRLPFFHRNVDCDEVILYHSGQFFSRAGIGPGMLTFHPSGLHHGPQPGAVDRDRAAAEAARAGDGKVHVRTDEYAVMIDVFRPLHPVPSDAAAAAEVEGYVASWSSEPANR
ncbi:MAG TPA: homogentisate 1,2-dioxygenase [Acidimicrobiales bacterium]|jgi:homogentisate 1,2-dioxygenase|nr:homogentisate 1,2-dioxygenase [Acidimicrobiales bacterium]